MTEAITISGKPEPEKSPTMTAAAVSEVGPMWKVFVCPKVPSPLPYMTTSPSKDCSLATMSVCPSRSKSVATMNWTLRSPVEEVIAGPGKCPLRSFRKTLMLPVVSLVIRSGNPS